MLLKEILAHFQHKIVQILEFEVKIIRFSLFLGKVGNGMFFT